MDMEINFPGGKKVDATYKGFTVRTDQPKNEGGEGSAPEPFSLFIVSLGTCAGYYVLSFCQQREISSEGIKLMLRTTKNQQTRLIATIDIEIHVPQNFPEVYKKALIRSAEACAVKKHLEQPPTIRTTVKTL